ncbi:hypothetical protein M011DRAFT_456902 [Sporormia fimetaria CBS 119925]|uniref:Uncharacterized protein n=1 Tax=Sporormia fimetaria CBS 119925 TaxID=1340428 RepID=A0A6A6VJQ2_9PLEO|nr:hypothetical protein M011DRAFT_456902 [Sporormia fimetaria CBS 119925]
MKSASGRSKPQSESKRRWEPPALQWWNLCLLVLICWTSVALLQYFLIKSQTEGGIIFAPNVNDLPLRRTFAFLYLPTLLAVLFSIFVAWIDLDAKRFEPFHQLSKPGGASGKDSLLLHYPNDYIPIVPYLALRNRHWLVFWAATAFVLTTFGVVPLQAGIFSTKRMARSFPQTFLVPSKFDAVSQGFGMDTVSYAQSAYGILRLGETLPGFMMHDYALAPFEASVPDLPAHGTWTAPTTLYGMDIECEEARQGTASMVDLSFRPILNNSVSSFGMISSNCTYKSENLFGDLVIGTRPNVSTNANGLVTKRFSAIYELVQSEDGDRFVGGNCEEEASKGTFLAAIVENKVGAKDKVKNGTALFCRQKYYQQSVRATVDALTKKPITIEETGERAPLSPLIDALALETVEFTLSPNIDTNAFQSRAGRIDFNTDAGFLWNIRENYYPYMQMPTYWDELSTSNLSEVMTIRPFLEPDYLRHMAAMALTTSDRSVEDNLDPTVLTESYRKAYRLLFARAVSEVLGAEYILEKAEVAGERQEPTESFVLEPIFTYLIEALLCIISICGLALLYMSIVRRRQEVLFSDPGAIASTMSLVADSEPLLSTFAEIDGCSTKYMEDTLRERRYRLDKGCIVETTAPSRTNHPQASSEPQIARAIRPTEVHLLVLLPFTGLFVGLAVAGGVLYYKSKPHGLPLPSKDKFTQNLVKDYIPTAIATMIEPIWIMLNRLYCMLQPLETLRGSKSPASKSIALNYSSLPPQLTIFKALRAGHVVLASVCTMALLANILAAAFAGLFHQETVSIPTPMPYAVPLMAKFIELDGTAGPPDAIAGFPTMAMPPHNGAYRGGEGEGHILVAESNYTYGTPLTFWTDEHAFYQPFFDSKSTSQRGDQMYRGRTKFISADLECEQVSVPLQLNPSGFHLDPGHEEKGPLPLNITGRDGQISACLSSMDQGETVVYEPTRSRLWNIGCEGETRCEMDGEYRRAAEMVSTLHAGTEYTKMLHDWGAVPETCMSAVALGWYRFPEVGIEDATPANSLMLTCKPRLIIGDATVTVNSEGRIVEKVVDRTPDPDSDQPSHLNRYFANDPVHLIGQSNLFIFRAFRSELRHLHNETEATELIHYFINREANHTRLTDPSLPAPTFDEVMEPLRKAYTRLFAIWLGVHKDALLERAPADAAPLIQGSRIYREERVFFTFPLFIVSEVILGIYIIASILVYLRRPGHYLPRMPTSLAAITALFAPSAAVEDLKGTSTFTTKERERVLKEGDWKYGYGSYVGTDGAVHVGIEKAQFVGIQRAGTTFEGVRFDRERKRTWTSVQVSPVSSVQQSTRDQPWWKRLGKGVGT